MEAAQLAQMRNDVTAVQSRVDKLLSENAQLKEVVEDLVGRVKVLETAKAEAKEAPAKARA